MKRTLIALLIAVVYCTGLTTAMLHASQAQAASVPVVYTMTGCSHCEDLKAALKQKGIKFIEKRDASKYSAFPTTEVAGKTIIGDQADVIIALAK